MRERAAWVLVIPWSPLPTLKLQKQREFQLRPHVRFRGRLGAVKCGPLTSLKIKIARTVRDVMAIYLKTLEDVPDRLFNQKL